MSDLPRVLISIHFDNQPKRRAIEVGDIRPDRMLTPKMKSCAIAAQHGPGQGFGIAASLSEFAGARRFLFSAVEAGHALMIPS